MVIAASRPKSLATVAAKVPLMVVRLTNWLAPDGGADASRTLDSIHGDGHVGDGGSAGKGDLDGALVAAEFDGDVVEGAQCAADVAGGGGLPALGDGHDDVHGRVIGKVGRVDLHRRDVGGGHAAGGVGEIAVEQLGALEGGAAGEAVDRTEDRVNLNLVGLCFRGGEAAGAGRLIDECLELVQQRADFAQTTLGGADDVTGAFGVADGLVNAGFFSAKIFAGDEASRIIRAAIDAKAGAEALKRAAQIVLVLAQHALRYQRADIGVDSAHSSVSSVTGRGNIPWRG